jgi:predicted DNA-binding protein (MmcQ/YjbR family)
MNLEIIREYCLKKRGVTEEFPFGENTPVYKLMGKIFLIASISIPVTINLKCDPEKAVELRERYPSVVPGYHMNKMHWNTVTIDNTIPDKLILQWIDDSFKLIFNRLKKADKEKLLKEE